MFTFVIKQENLLKRFLYFILGNYYFFTRLVSNTEKAKNTFPGQISDDVYPLM